MRLQPPLSKRGSVGEPIPPEAFWAVSPGINWSWYALLLPEDDGFRILRYDRIHHGDDAPKTRTGVDLIEDKARTVTGVRLTGEHSTNLKVAPVTNPGHVFEYPHITSEDEASFTKKEEKLEEKEAATKSPLSKRAAGGPRVKGDKIRLRGHGTIKFEIVDVAIHGEETFYKVKPVDTIYGVSEDLVEEERSKEKKPLVGSVTVPLSKRADETPVIPIGEGYAKREINKIREENQRKIKEEGLDRPPQYPEKHTFFGEQFLPGDIIVKKKEPGKPWKIVDRHENKRLGIAYSVQSMEEALIWAQDVARGMKGGYLLDLPQSEWDVPGKGLPLTKPQIVDKPPKHLSKRQQIEEENKQQLAGLNSRERAQEELNHQKWLRLVPLAKKLIERLEPLAKGQSTFEHPNWELKTLKDQLDQGYRARLVHQFENAIKEAY
jgi:hypothetical protein